MPKPSLHLTFLQTSVHQQLSIEEALLRTDQRNICLVNRGTPPAIVMGISGQADRLIDREVWESAPVPIIKRFSGGGTVFVDPSTWFVTWIMNSEDVGVKGCPVAIHGWSAEIYRQAFPALNLQLIENDYVIGQRKCGGNAQYLTKGRWLHHTSFLWDYDPANMRYLLMPQKRPAYRQNRPHDAFLCRLSEHFPSFAQMQQLLLESLETRFEVHAMAEAQLTEICTRPHRKSTLFVELPDGIAQGHDIK